MLLLISPVLYYFKITFKKMYPLKTSFIILILYHRECNLGKDTVNVQPKEDALSEVS